MHEQELHDAIFALIVASREAYETASQDLGEGLTALVKEMLPQVIVGLMIKQRREVSQLRISLEPGPEAFKLLGAVQVSQALAKVLGLLDQWLGDQLSTLN